MTHRSLRRGATLAAVACAVASSGCLKVLYYVQIDHHARVKVTQIIQVERKVLMLQESVPGGDRAETILTREHAEQHAKMMGSRLAHFKVERTNDGGLKATAVYFCSHVNHLKLPMYPWPTQQAPYGWQEATIRFTYADDEVKGERRLHVSAGRPQPSAGGPDARHPPRRRTPAEMQKLRKLLPVFRDMIKGFELMLRIQVCKKKEWLEGRYRPSDGQLTPLWITDKDLIFDEDTLMFVVPWNIVGNEKAIKSRLENSQYTIHNLADHRGWGIGEMHWHYLRHLGVWRYRGYDVDWGVTRLLPVAMQIPPIELPPVPPGKRYQRKYIGRAWRHLGLQKASDIPRDFMQPGFDDSGWKEIDVGLGEAIRPEPFLLYRKRLTVPAHWKGRLVRLDFRGVRDRCIVYLNGAEIGRNDGWNRHFQIDVSHAIRYTATNLLALRVQNLTDTGGIWRAVYVGDTRLTSEFHLTREETLAEETPKQNDLRAQLPHLPGIIAFQMHKPRETEMKENWDIYTIKPDGTSLQAVVKHPAADCHPRISPDGKTVLFVSLRDNWQKVLTMRKVPPYVLERYGVWYSVGIHGQGKPKRLWPAKGLGADAAWFPDGKAIAFAQRNPPRIHIKALATGNVVSHAPPEASQCVTPCVAPDGRRILFVNLLPEEGEDQYGSGVVAYLDPQTYQLTAQQWGRFGVRMAKRVRWVDVSPDNKHVAYTMTDHFWKIRYNWLMDTITGEPPRFHGTDLGFKEAKMRPRHAGYALRRMYNECPVWAPNSRYILFVRGPDHAEASYLQFTRRSGLVDWMDLYLADPAGKRCIRLTWLRSRMGWPHWWAPRK